MDSAGVDLVLCTSKHNVQYLLGGYQFFFFAHMDAIGISRYLPALGYPKGHPERAFYIGNIQENWQQEFEPLWTPTIKNNAWTSEDVATYAAAYIGALNLGSSTIAIEQSFLPADCFKSLRRLLPGAEFVEALPILEDLRAVKQAWELDLIKKASEAVVDSMLAVFSATGHGTTTAEVAEALRHEQIQRGLNFDYCLASTGQSFNRYPSDAKWEAGNGICLDSGGNKLGYIGDLARMAVMGRPTPLMVEILEEIAAVQMAARMPIRPGALGREIFDRAMTEMASCAHRASASFIAHGMGLVSHEAPRLTSSGPVPYPASHAERPLEVGMVLSVETSVQDARAGYVKLEDTICVTETGWEAYGDYGRGWNLAEAGSLTGQRSMQASNLSKTLRQ